MFDSSQQRLEFQFHHISQRWSSLIKCPTNALFFAAFNPVLCLKFGLKFPEPSQSFYEVGKSSNRKHDRSAATADIFGDLEIASALIFL